MTTLTTSPARRVAEAVAALDFAQENAAVEALQHEIAANEAAVAKAQERQAEIGRLLFDFAGPDGRAVADALLADIDAPLAAQAGPDRPALQMETASLSAAIKDLNARSNAAHGAIKEIHNEAYAKAAGAAAPLIESEIAAAREAAARLSEAYVAFEAIWYATRGAAHESAMTRNAMQAIMGSGKLLSWRRTREVPSAVKEALSGLIGKGVALPASLPAEIMLP